MTYTSLGMPLSGDTVIVGLSGGVDSTLTAFLLKQQGCKVIGVTMSMWDGSLPQTKGDKPLSTSCFGPGEEQNIAECKAFCADLGIEYHVIDVREQYRKEVLEYFKAEYRAGRTPNPCVRCNRLVKFGALLDGIAALGIDYDYFCTGHYAQIVRPTSGIYNTSVMPAMIAGATDLAKDQTYFLYRIPSDVLEKVRFPLASMKKEEVFALAKEARLQAAQRQESQDFIGEEYFDMLFSDKPSVKGDIIDLDGKVLGHHRGIEHYTIGQRRGLGVAVNYPVYVQAIDAKSNTVVLAPNDALNSVALIADDFVWPGAVEPKETLECLVKIRLASRPVKATIQKVETDSSRTAEKAEWKITFVEPQRAVAPGQSVVLYEDGVIIGGGIIKTAIKT